MQTVPRFLACALGAVVTVGALSAPVVDAASAAAAPPHPSAAAPHPGPIAATDGAPAPGWTGTWEAAPSGVGALDCADCTVRDVLHSTIAGQSVRVRISNVFGTAPLALGHATVALPASAGSATVAPGTLRVLRFHGASAVSIAAGASVLSDPVPLALPADSDLLVTTYTPGAPGPLTFHPSAQQDSYYAPGGDRATDPTGTDFTGRTASWYLVTGVEVANARARGAVVAFGDSITDGYQSTYDVDHRWPDRLADRLAAAHRTTGVLNAGIGGNRILLDSGDGFGPPALARYDRDVLSQPGARTVIILLGINDIQQAPHQYDPAAIIAGLRQLVDRAHARGLRVMGATITPYEGWNVYEPAGESAREAVNTWIRTSGAYDSVVDFDAVVRDPADPHRILAAYDSGDHLHPNDSGYAAMGDAINLGRL